MEHSFEDIHVAAETLADSNNRFGSDGTAASRSVQFLNVPGSRITNPFTTNTLSSPDPHGHGEWGMIISNLGIPTAHRHHANSQLQRQGRANLNLNTGLGNAVNANVSANMNAYDGDLFSDNINIDSLFNILHGPNVNHGHSHTHQSRAYERSSAFDNDSLWSRTRLDGIDDDDDDDDISVDSQSFDAIDTLGTTRLRTQLPRAAANIDITTSTTNTSNGITPNSSILTDAAVDRGLSETANINIINQGNEPDASKPPALHVNNNPEVGIASIPPFRMTRSMARGHWQFPTSNAYANRLDDAELTGTDSSAHVSNSQPSQLTIGSRPRRGRLSSLPSSTGRNLSTDSNSAPSHPNTRAYCKRNFCDRSNSSSASKKAKSSRDRKHSARVKSEDVSDSASTSSASSKQPEEKMEEKDDAEKCCICLEVPSSKELAKIDGCDHSYCFSCIEQWAARENTCPQCKSRFKEIRKVRVSSGTVKKVKDRDQRSDFRQHLHIQSLFAHMEAHIEANGLNFLLTAGGGGNAFLRDARAARNSAPTFASALASQRFSSFLLQSAPQGTSAATNTNGNATRILDLPRRTRLARRGTSRSSTNDGGRFRMLGSRNLDINFGALGNRTTSNRSSPLEAINEIPVPRDVVSSSVSSSAFDYDFLERSNPFLEPGLRAGPRSFAVNAHQEGAGFSADTALEILDDSDDDSEVQIY